MRKDELEFAKIIEQAISKKNEPITKESVLKAIKSFGYIKVSQAKELFNKVGFNRYVLKGEIKPFYKIENIDGEDYFVVVHEK